MSLDGVYLPTLVKGCWLSPFGCTKQDFSIQEVHQSCWCILLFHCSGHVDDLNQEHIWCLTDMFRWRKRCMLTDCWGGTPFHQYRIFLQHTGWYCPHALCWHYSCCARTIIGIHLCCSPSTILTPMSSDRTLVQAMAYHPIFWWLFPSWDYMMHFQHSQKSWSPPPSGGLFPYFPCFVFLNDSISSLRFVWFGAFTVSFVLAFTPTIFSCDVFKVSLGFLFLLFSSVFIISGFTTLVEH